MFARPLPNPSPPHPALASRDYHLQAEKAEREASKDVARAAFQSMGASPSTAGAAAGALVLLRCPPG